jgi:malate dehydrogenase
VSRSEVLPQNLPLLKSISEYILEYCPNAIVITVTNPVDPLNYAMYRFTGIDRKKLIGYSANDTLRFRMFLSEELNIASKKIEAAVLGEHGASQVLLFSSVRVDNAAYNVSQSVKKQVRQKVDNLPSVLEPQRIKTGRTAAWTTSMGLTDICRAIKMDSGLVMPCSVVLDGEYQCRNISMSVPVKIGKQGVTSISELKIDAEEQGHLSRSIDVLRGQMQFVDEYISK